MADKFNWDDHPVVDPNAAKGGFSWDDHPLVDQQQREESTGKRLLRSTINTVVPAVTGIGAAALATPETVGVGTLPAGALGYAAGKQLARILNNRLLGDADEAKNVGDQVTRSAKDVGEGALYEMAGQSIGALPGLAKSGAKAANQMVKNQLGRGVEYTPIANKESVERAAEALNLKVPRAMLTDNKTFQELESGLSQSGSFPAKKVRNEYEAFNKGLENAANKIEDLKSSSSDFKIGASIKDDLAKQVVGSAKPISEMYAELHPEMKNIEVNESVVNRAFGALKRNPLFQTSEGKVLAEEYQQAVKSQPELASLKELRSTLHDSLGRDASPLEEKRVNALYDAITSVRDNTINSLKDGRSVTGGKFDELIDKISNADSAHAAHLEDLNSIRGIVGGKEIGSPTAFLRKLGDMKESDLAQRVANLDVNSLRNLQQKYPSVFEKAQSAKINDMVQSSTNPVSGFNPNRFLKQYNELDKEARELIFPEGMRSHIEHLETIIQAKPAKLGPSGTPGGQMTMEMFSPRRNALDFGIRKVLDSSVKASAPDVAPMASAGSYGDRLRSVSRPASALKAFPGADAPMNLPKAADQKNDRAPIKKGSEKWADDGLQKLKDHADSSDRSAIQSLDSAQASPKIKQLLIQASDLKPGTKAMARVLAQIKEELRRSG